jgi:hypothetical protein
MTKLDARYLKLGDSVWWDDPDDGICSRLYKIKTIRIGGVIIFIEDEKGDFLECEAHELSLAVEKPFCAKVYWEMSGEVEVKAYSKAHAAKLAIDAPLPPSDKWQYVPDSFNVDAEMDVQEIQNPS